MTKITSPLALYKLLPGTNCRQCLLPSCMAFAVAVVKGEKKPRECPFLKGDILDMMDGGIEKQKTLEDEQRAAIADLQRQVAALDFAEASPRIGARLIAGSLAIPCALVWK